MKIHASFACIPVAALLFFSCDIIDNPIIPGPNGCNVSEPSFTPRQNPVRKVLIEDFTGHRCGNCPEAGDEIHDLIVTHGDKVVAIAHHSSNMTAFTPPDPNPNSVKYKYDFRTTVSTAVDNKFGINTIGIPNGLVNRKTVNGSKIVPYTSWASTVSGLLAVPPDMDIQVKNFYDPADSSLCAFIYVQGLTQRTGSFKVVAYLVENEFVNWQKRYGNEPEDISDYEHNHVLRTSLTTPDGTALADTINAGQTFINGYSVKVDPSRWNPDNCYVIAFVYEDGSDEVFQVEQQKVIE